MANNRPTLYTGVTSHLEKRVYEHKHHLVKGFTDKYDLNKLVYYEAFESIYEAIIREKQIKDMDRVEKIAMIKKTNPYFKDLYPMILDTCPQMLRIKRCRREPG